MSSQHDGLGPYLDRLASADPIPGGGSAAALAGAAGAALVAMVARITLTSGRLAAVHPPAAGLVEEADRVRAALLSAQARDEHAYGRVAAAMKLPRETEHERGARTAELQLALAGAAAAPLEIAALAREVAALTERALELGNANLASDLGCAAVFADAAVRAAAYNVRVNHHYLKDADLVRAQSAELEAIEHAVRAAHDRVVAKLSAPL